MKVLLALIFTAATLVSKSQPSADIIEYVSKYKQLAMDEMQRTGIPAAIKLAQGIHETSAGKSVLVLKSNNHFGIKCKAYWTGQKVYHDDDARGECFRRYEQAEDSYRDHSNFLKAGERYASLFLLEPTDYRSWATGLRKAGYATNPKYAPIIIRLIEEYNLQQYSLIALGKMAPNEEAVASQPKPVTDSLPLEMPVEVVPEQPAAEIPAPEAMPVPAVTYPSGEFTINNTRVIFAQQGSSLLSIAQQHDIPLRRLLDFNDLTNEEILSKDQLMYLQRKRKTGNKEFHIVANGENLHDICQAEAIRLESLLQLNQLRKSMQPAVGEKLYLQAQSPSRPKL